MTDTNFTLPANQEKVQVVTNNQFPFLDMKMSWYLQGDLQFSAFRKHLQQLNYPGIGSIHTPGTLNTIPLQVLNCLVELTLIKTSLCYQKAEKIYHNQAIALHKAGLAPPICFLQWETFGENQDKKMDIENKKGVNVTKKKTELSTFVLHTHVIFLRLSTGLSTG